MSMARISTISGRKSESETRKTYASLRITGDDLEPEAVTRILRAVPTSAYRKGEAYRSGERDLKSRTGVWLLSTDHIVASDSLQHHLDYIFAILILGRQDAEPLIHLRNLLMHRKRWKADIACFWHGRFGAKRPSIPRRITDLAKLIPADIETDFDTDSEEVDRHRAAG